MTGGLDPEHPTAAAVRFLDWAEHVGAEAPMYARFCRKVAGDPEILALVGGAAPTQPPANLLFAAVHYLLLGGAGPELGRHYPTVADGGSSPDGDPWPLFRRFCLDHAAEITGLVATQTVQTNECRRSIAWLPALAIVGGGRPLAIVELGAAAGLNLRFEHYGYDYGPAGTAGDPSSLVTLTTEVRGELLPPVPGDVPDAPWRVGIDLQPIDVTDPDRVRWAAALLWPNQIDRRDRLLAASTIARAHPIRMVTGDAAADGARIAAGAPGDLHLVVLHSFMLNQLDEDARATLDDGLRALSMHRPVDRLSMEWLRPDAGPMLRLLGYRSGKRSTSDLARVHHHGAWIEWLDPETGRTPA